MNYKLPEELPPLLEPLREKIEATLRPYIAIAPEITSETSWTQSKFGGLPYLPKNIEYPKARDGHYLFLLAQINFAEVPHLEPFPQKGILQFYIADDDLYGADFDNPINQDGFRILYFPDPSDRVNDLTTDFSFLSKPDFSPLGDCISRLEFTAKVAPVSFVDYRSTELFQAECDRLSDRDYWNLVGEYERFFMDTKHSQIGGYPYFVQDDPRDANAEKEQLDCLLLQIPSSSSPDIMWGDGGIGNFFIKTSDLKKLDFTNVLYNWDCG
ncbi:MAG: YwqG family protein [Cyanobacteria bacterium P01_E01_bin.42]